MKKTTMNKAKTFLAVLIFSSSSFAQITAADIPPKPVNNCGSNGGSEDYQYQNCINNFNSQLSSWNRNYGAAASNQHVAAMNTNVQKPVHPGYASCTTVNANGTTTVNDSCKQGLDQRHQNNLNAYNHTLEMERIAAEQRNAAQQQYDSAKQAALDAQKRNEKAQSKYNLAGTLTGIASGVGFSTFAASCTSAGCSCGACLALGIAMAIYSLKSSKQANSHDGREYDACNLANTISTSQANCGPAPGPFVPTTFPNTTNPPLTQIVDNNGNCIASPEMCQQIKENLPPGTNLRDFRRGIDAFVAGKIPAKVNPDGSITSRGKRYDINDFSSYDKLRQAGLSPEQAKLAMSEIAKGNSIAGNFDAKAALASENGVGADGALDGDGSASAQTAGTGAAGTGNGAGLGNTDGTGGRTLASESEGLTSDFNGDIVGASGDNIWKMMNRRYRLKDNQDSFLQHVMATKAPRP